jgi:SAM-dependent methyltransferase
MSGTARVLAQVMGDLALRRDAAILDAAAAGRNLVRLRGARNRDRTRAGAGNLALARDRNVGEVVEGTLDGALPFDDDTFALATALDVIEHLDDDVGALRELRRVVAPDGRLLVTVPCYPWLWSSHDVVNQHRRRYTKRTLHRAASLAGWEPVRTLHFNMLLLPVAAVAPARAAGRGDEGIGPRAHAAFPLIAMAAVRQRVIGKGINPPAGLSLLCVMRPPTDRRCAMRCGARGGGCNANPSTAPMVAR